MKPETKWDGVERRNPVETRNSESTAIRYGRRRGDMNEPSIAPDKPEFSICDCNSCRIARGAFPMPHNKPCTKAESIAPEPEPVDFLHPDFPEVFCPKCGLSSRYNMVSPIGHTLAGQTIWKHFGGSNSSCGYEWIVPDRIQPRKGAEGAVKTCGISVLSKSRGCFECALKEGHEGDHQPNLAEGAVKPCGEPVANSTCTRPKGHPDGCMLGGGWDAPASKGAVKPDRDATIENVIQRLRNMVECKCIQCQDCLHQNLLRPIRMLESLLNRAPDQQEGIQSQIEKR